MADTARSEAGHCPAQDLGLLLLRLALGVIFVAHGGQKLFGWFGGPGPAATVHEFHAGLGIPVPLAYLAMFTEFFGGLALIAGLLARLASIGIGFTMVVAVLTVHLKNGFFLGSAKTGAGPGFEYNLALFAMALAVALVGPGRWALADLEPRWMRRR